MRWNEQITLIAQSDADPRTDANGFPTAPQERSTTVFADEKSVGYSEFYKAEMAGYKASLKVDVRSFEYEGQQVAEYPPNSGKRYRVIRTYKHGEFTELTLSDVPSAQGGNNG